MEFILNSGPDPLAVEVRLVLHRISRLRDRIGLPLYRSELTPVQLTGGVDDVVTFELPNVSVPDSFIWALEFSGFEPYIEAPRIPMYGPAEIGDDDPTGEGYWYYNILGRRWLFQDIVGTSFYCRITAVGSPD